MATSKFKGVNEEKISLEKDLNISRCDRRKTHIGFYTERVRKGPKILVP